MSKQPRKSKQNRNGNPSELDQFEAYGAYSYEYAHQETERDEYSGSYYQPDTSDGYYPPNASEYYPPTGPDTWYEEPAEPGRAQRIPLEKEAPKRRRYALWARLVLLVVAAVVGLVILQGTVFRLQYVYVVGNENKTNEQIVANSGLVKGLNIFAINEDDIRRHLSKDHTIVLLRIQKELPNAVYLYVRERVSVASMQCRGLLYTMDEEGLVMQESSNMLLPEGMPAVTGMQVTSIQVGQPLEVKDPRQLAAYQNIMMELRLQLYSDQISELNIYNPDNLYLVTVDGVTVRLGKNEYIRAKIGALRTDMAYLRQLGKASGILDVSIPEDAKYMPES